MYKSGRLFVFFIDWTTVQTGKRDDLHKVQERKCLTWSQVLHCLFIIYLVSVNLEGLTSGEILQICKDAKKNMGLNSEMIQFGVITGRKINTTSLQRARDKCSFEHNRSAGLRRSRDDGPPDLEWAPDALRSSTLPLGSSTTGHKSSVSASEAIKVKNNVLFFSNAGSTPWYTSVIRLSLTHIDTSAAQIHLVVTVSSASLHRASVLTCDITTPRCTNGLRWKGTTTGNKTNIPMVE